MIQIVPLNELFVLSPAITKLYQLTSFLVLQDNGHTNSEINLS